MTIQFTPGSLVRARNREWVVLPESQDNLLVLRPLGGTDDEVTGVLTTLEKVEPAQFDLPVPDPRKMGDHHSCGMLRDAVRLSFRSSAGPFRSFARIAVDPRPYQLVPLLMALKLDPVRLLIADDVGIGKTIEAGLVARELLDRNDVQRLAVLCPPQLAEQWQTELRDKFHINAELVLSSTAARLERNCRLGQSLFELYPFVVVSADFIKSDRRRDDFLRACPELVIVDEAHTFAFGAERGRHQRHQLLTGLAANPDRHMVLVTATPHSGNESAFRSLLRLLDAGFTDMPEDLNSKESDTIRKHLAQHFVQRRRADIQHYLDTDTPFPRREEKEESYKLSADYKRFFDRVLRYVRETVADTSGTHYHQRVRWWSVLALLRALASSPAAAATTLRNRAAAASVTTAEEADDIGRRTVLDQVGEDLDEGADIVPGSDYSDAGDQDLSDQPQSQPSALRRRLLDMAREADGLCGSQDAKLAQAVSAVKKLIADGFHPIVFCRFIQTAEYVAAALRAALPKSVEIAAVTGTLPPEEREARVAALGKAESHVLVATDCLSEGINLQQHFDAVLHYDLSWNPTRHEQREGRVDRYGQPASTVRVITYYGLDNQIDGIVLDVLIRKHRTIRNSLGISVPVPVDSDAIVEAMFEGLLLREQTGRDNAQQLALFEDLVKPQKQALYAQWENAAEREKRSRTVFAQQTIKVDEVTRELQTARSAIGSTTSVEQFVIEALRAHGAVVKGQSRSAQTSGGTYTVDFGEAPRTLREATHLHSALTGSSQPHVIKARFQLPVHDDELYLSRTHPLVEGLATYVMDTALDPLGNSIARRCGAIRTRAVQRRTTLLLARFRYHILTIGSRRAVSAHPPLLAEDCSVVAFGGAPASAQWLSDDVANDLLLAQPDGNIGPDQATEFIRKVVDDFSLLRQHLDEVANERAAALLDAHQRVRAATHARGVSYRVEPQLPVDVLGVYVYLPV